MKIRNPPLTRQLSWRAVIALEVGTVVRDQEGETGTVVVFDWRGKRYKKVNWDDGCVTPLDKISKKYKTNIYLLRKP